MPSIAKSPTTTPDQARHVTQSNALIRAAHGLSLAEKRLVALAVTKLDSVKVLAPGEVPIAKITAAEYTKVFKVERQNAYTQLAESSELLRKRTIAYLEPFGPRSKRTPARVKMCWVGRAKYHDGEGWVELAFWPELLPHLTGLKAEFTRYRLEQATALRSVTSWRLMELLQRFAKTGWATYTITELCDALDATAPQRKDFGKIRTQLIEPAITELTDKAGWVIGWEPIKTNRKVTSITFTFKPPR